MPLPDKCKNILDIGCGCGVISLMLAQRTCANITGIDMDEKSVKEAQRNAENSPWNNRLQFVHENIQGFAKESTPKYDVIVSNPPFFENSLKSPETNRNISRHNETLSLKDLIETVNILLSENGCFGVILSVVAAKKFEKLMLVSHLFASKKILIYPTTIKKPNRLLMLFERKPAVCKETQLIIRDNGYTKEYLELVSEYLQITNYELQITR
jgi:tRNA1Val (adenine37-N6)-methyltransferase